MADDIFGAIKGFFQKVFGFIHSAAVKINQVFVPLFGEAATQHFFTAAEQMFKSSAGTLAKDAVLFAEGLVAGTDKRAAAFSKLVADTEKAGLKVPKSILNLLVEMAVQKFTKIKI